MSKIQSGAIFAYTSMASPVSLNVHNPCYGRILRWRLTYVVIASLLLILDYESSALIQFPITFVIPVILASWFCAPHIGYLFAVGMAVVRLSFDIVWDSSALLQSGIVNAFINVSVLVFIAYITNKAVRLMREVKVLQGILPTCCFCKKIRDKDDHWKSMEVYIETRTDAQFSHGICPDCAQLHYGDILKKTVPPH